MQYVHYWEYIWTKYRPWCRASLLKWSRSLWSTEKAKCSIYTTSCGESEAAQGRENRSKLSPLSGSTQSGARANILSINAIFKSTISGGCCFAVCVLVCSHRICWSLSSCSLSIVYSSHILFPTHFLWSSPPLQQHWAPTQRIVAERRFLSHIFLRKYNAVAHLIGPVMKLTCPAGHKCSMNLQTGSKSIDLLIPRLLLKLWTDVNLNISAYF